MELRLMESYKRRGGAGEEEEGSASSALSPHSHPHLADLDEDDSACEEELARLAAQVIHIQMVDISISTFRFLQKKFITFLIIS